MATNGILAQKTAWRKQNLFRRAVVTGNASKAYKGISYSK